MDTAVKTIESAMDKILNPTADDLRKEEARLKEKLQEKAIAGDAGAVMSLQAELRDLPLRIRAVEVGELRKELDAVEAAFEQLDRDEQELQVLRREANDKRLPVIEKLNDLTTEFQKVEFALSVVFTKRQSALEKRRNIKARIQQIVEELKQ